MGRLNIVEFLLAPLIVIAVSFIIFWYFSGGGLAITIGGDTYGNMASYIQSKHGGSLENTTDFFKGNINIPNTIQDKIEGFIGYIADNQAEYVNIHFFLTVLSPFFLAYLIIRHETSSTNYSVYHSLIGAYLIALSAFNILHFLAGHYTLWLSFLLLWLYFFYRSYAYVSYKSSIAHGIAYGAMTIFSPYFGYFGFFFYLYALTYTFIYDRNAFLKYLPKYLVALLIATLIVAAEFSQTLMHIFLAQNEPIDATMNRSLAEVAGVMPYMYFLPSPQSIFSQQTYIDFLRRAMVIANIPENAVYIGVFNIIFFCIALRFFWKNEFPQRVHFWFRFILGASVVLFLISLPPFIPLPEGERFYWISAYLHKIFPMFRMYGRAGIFVLILVTVGSLIGFYYFLQKYKHYRTKIIAMSFLVIAVDITPKLPSLDVVTYPPVYDWLANQEGNFLVYEIPEDYLYTEKDYFQFYKYVYFYSVHGKKLINRADITPKLDSYDFYVRLKNRGVRYVIQHERLYKEGPIPMEYKNYVHRKVSEEMFNGGMTESLPPWYRLVAKIGDAQVYELP